MSLKDPTNSLFTLDHFGKHQRSELAMHVFSVIAASAVILSGTQIAAAANSMRIAETGAFVLGNAHRCGVADDRVVRAGKVIRELITAASDDPSEQMAARSRFAEMFRIAARAEAAGRVSIPPCKGVLAQFERLEHFRDSPGLLTAPRSP
jgi:hypothetical protein